MRFTPWNSLGDFEKGSLSTCKDFWSQFAHSCPHWSYNIPGIKSALRFKNKMGGTNWIRSPWQTPPQQNVLPIGEIAIKRDVYFFPLTLLSLSMSLQPAVSVLKDQFAWGLSHQPSGFSPDTPLQSPLHVPQTPTASQTQKQSKQNASLPVLSCLREGHRRGLCCSQL